MCFKLYCILREAKLPCLSNKISILMVASCISDDTQNYEPVTFTFRNDVDNGTVKLVILVIIQ